MRHRVNLPAAAWALAATAAAPALRGLLRVRVRRGKELAERLAERRGQDSAPRPPGRLLWMHAASVGETISVLPVLQAASGVALLLTTGTVTSARIAAERLPPGALHRFAPLDVPRWVQRFLDHWQPDAACFVESEIWPNMLAALDARGIPRALLNARLSAGSFGRWQRVPGLARRLFGGFALVQARSAADAARIEALTGRPVERTGDLKFAAPALPAEPAALAAAQAQLAGRPMWVAASLHPGEDRQVVAAHDRLAAEMPGLTTVLVPRHPSRAAAMLAERPMPQRSAGAPLPAGGLYLADTLGELGLFYRLAGCALIGGSLVPHGGQNPLEAARLGCPVIAGPHTGNFEDAYGVLREAGALAHLADAAALPGAIRQLLADPAARQIAADAARAATERWAGLPAASAAALLALMA